MKTIVAFVLGAALAALYQSAAEAKDPGAYVFGTYGSASLSLRRPEMTQELSSSRTSTVGVGWCFKSPWSLEVASHDFGEFVANAEKFVTLTKTVEYRDVHITPPRVIRLPDGRYVFNGPTTTRDTHTREISYTARIPGTVELSAAGFSLGARYTHPDTGLFAKVAVARVDAQLDVSALGLSRLYRRSGTVPLASVGVVWGKLRLEYTAMPKYGALSVGVEVPLN